MDLSQLSTDDLKALQKGDLKSVSTAGLQYLQSQQPSTHQPNPDIQTAQNLQMNTGSMNPNALIPVPSQLTGQIPASNEFQTGNAIAQQQAQSQGAAGMNPYLSAALAMPAAMAAPVANTAYTAAAMGGPQGIANTIQAIPGALKNAGSSIADLASAAKNRIMQGPATEQIGTLNGQMSAADLAAQQAQTLRANQILQLQQQQKQLPIDMRNVLATRESEMMPSLSQNIGEVRNAAGIPQNINPRFPSSPVLNKLKSGDISGLAEGANQATPTPGEINKFADYMKNTVGKIDPDELAKQGPQFLAHLKDTADRLSREVNLNTTQQKYIQTGIDNVMSGFKSLDMPEVPSAYQAYGQGKQLIEQTPLDYKQMGTNLGNQINSLQQEGNTAATAAAQQKNDTLQQIQQLQTKSDLEKRIRLGGALGAGTGLSAAGYYALKKLAGLGGGQ